MKLWELRGVSANGHRAVIRRLAETLEEEAIGIANRERIKVSDCVLVDPAKPPPAFVTEPTEQGNQFVIPGCEKDKTRGPRQMDLF